MNSYIQNLRNGNVKQHNRVRPNFENAPFGPHNPRSPNDKRRPTGRMPTSGPVDAGAQQLTESMSALKSILENINEKQGRLLELSQRRADIEDRKATAMENISQFLGQLAQNGLPALSSQPAGVYDTAQIAAEIQTDVMPLKPPLNERKKVLRIIHTMREQGNTYDQIAAYLDKVNIKTFSGRGLWHAQTIHRLHQKITDKGKYGIAD